MGKKELESRDKWQDKSGPKGELAEGKFEIVFLREFSGTNYTIRKNPDELKDIYSKDPKHGVVIDYAITNSKTNKTSMLKVKPSQDMAGVMHMKDHVNFLHRD